MLDFININAYQDISDFVIFAPDKKFFDNNILRKNSIIFCKIEQLLNLFNKIRFSGNHYIIITAGSDYFIDKNIFEQRPPSVKRIYAQNAIYDHPDLISIPIGLGPHKGATAWVPDEDGTQYTLWYEENIKKLQDTKKDKSKLYCNWNVNNNPKLRLGILKKLKNNKLNYFWGRGEIEENIEYVSPYKYYKDMSKCQFTISPPGNGLDCHRTWEALYMGSIPIVIKHRIYREFGDLPIIQINDYSEVTYDLIYSYLNKEYDYKKLYMKYWKNRIMNEI